MPTRNISLTDELDAFVEDLVASGRYGNASEAMREALREMKSRTDADVVKREILRAHLAAGMEALDRGDFVEIGEDVDAALDALTAPGSTAG